MLINSKFKKHPYRLYALELLFFAGYLLDIGLLLIEFDAYYIFKGIVNFFEALQFKSSTTVEDESGKFMFFILYWNDFI